MKSILKIAVTLAALCGTSNAVVTIGGTIGTSVKGSDGATNIPVGSLYLIIANDGTSGLLTDGLTLAPPNSIVPVGADGSGLSSSADPGVYETSASITDGGFFGGDKIIGTGSIGTAGVLPYSLTSEDITGYESAQFAIIWFEKSSATLTSEGLANQKYGIISLADWTFPASGSGTFTMNSTDSSGAGSYFTTSLAITNAQVGTAGFFTGSGTVGDATNDTKSAIFTIVPIPEPTTALLAAFGSLALLRRRRN